MKQKNCSISIIIIWLAALFTDHQPQLSDAVSFFSCTSMESNAHNCGIVSDKGISVDRMWHGQGIQTCLAAFLPPYAVYRGNIFQLLRNWQSVLAVWMSSRLRSYFVPLYISVTGVLRACRAQTLFECTNPFSRLTEEWTERKRRIRSSFQNMVEN